MVAAESWYNGEQSLQEYSGRELMMKTLKVYCLLSWEPYCKTLIQEDGMKHGGEESEKEK